MVEVTAFLNETIFNWSLEHTSDMFVTKCTTLYKVHHSLTARSVPRYFREGLRKQAGNQPISTLESLTDVNVKNIHITDNVPPRNTPSPEHLGIPSSPALIPTRHYQLYPGDTSDDSAAGHNMIPRRTHKRRVVKS